MSAQTASARPARALRTSRTALAQAQKSGAGVPAYTRWINRRLARGVAAAAVRIGMTPNAVTLLSAAMSAAGIAVIAAAPPSAGSGVAAAVLLAAGYVLDSADGQVARLSGASSPAGEWLDHVVDAIRSPAIHLGVAVGCFVHRPQDVWLMGVALGFALLTSGQFMSQILAEQLASRHGRSVSEPSGVAKSVVLIPTDPGTLCWAFALWGAHAAFAAVYVLLFIANLIHAGISMRRKHRRLR